MKFRLALGVATILAVATMVAAPVRHGARAAPLQRVGATPIQHVVIIFQENHSFDDTLGKLCVVDSRCDGVTTGVLHDNTVIPLSQEPDIVPAMGHGPPAQITAINHGAMNGFDLVGNCTAAKKYACYTQFDPSQIPNLAALARSYAISDRTFEWGVPGSWGSHLVLAAATLDGFMGDGSVNSKANRVQGPGTGCDSGKQSNWWDGTKWVIEPQCVPDQNGNGPFRASPVPYVPTIFDRLDQGGLPWRIYGGGGYLGDGYGHQICPTFYECLSTQLGHLVPAETIVQDAASGALPALSIVTPTGVNSQHNLHSMARGDNWIGHVVDALMQSASWASTAIFVTYDDCGCLYDHVPPPNPLLGVRVPMVIASPYARPGYTDSQVASFISMLTFVEHTFGLPPLNGNDTAAYDYSNAFNFSQKPLPGVKTVDTKIPAWEQEWIRQNAPTTEEDPT